MKFIYSAIIGLFLFGGIAQANEIPKLTGRIVDPGGLISEKTKVTVQQKIKELETGSYPIYFVALVYDQKLDEPIEDFSVKTARAWGLGKKDIDNGVLFIIAPKSGVTRMEVGYRLEGMMPDAATKVMQENIVPLLKERKYGGSINGIIDQIKPLTLKEAKVEPIVFSNRDASYEEKQKGSGMGFLISIAVILVILFFLGRMIMRRIREDRESRIAEIQSTARIKREARLQADQAEKARRAEQERERVRREQNSAPIPVIDMEFPSQPSNVKRNPPAVEPKRYSTEPDRYSSKAVPLNTTRPKYEAKPLDLVTKTPITPAPPMRPNVKKSYPTPVRDTPTSRRHNDDDDSGLGSALLGGIAGAVIGSALSGGSSRDSDYGSSSKNDSDYGSSKPDDTYTGGGGGFGGGGATNDYGTDSSNVGGD